MYRLVVILAALLLSSAVCKAEPSAMQTGAANNVQVPHVLFGYQAPPDAYTDPQGRYTGYLVDITNEIQKQLDDNLDTLEVPNWDALIEHAKKHQGFVIVGITETQDRKAFLRFTPPFASVPYIVLVHESSDINNMAQLAGRTACTVSNYAVNDYMTWHHPEVRLIKMADDLTGLRAVSTGTCEAMIINQMYASYLIETQGITRLRVAAESGYVGQISAATSIHDKALFEQLQHALQQIPEQRLEEIYQKWVAASDSRVSNTTFNTLSVVLLLAVLLLVGFWFWSTSLRRLVKNKTQALKEEERRLSTLMGNLPGMAYRCLNDEHWSMLFVSNGCHSLTGYTAPQIVFNREIAFADLIVPEDRRHVTREILDAIAQNRPYELTYRIQRRDGAVRWVWERGRPTPSPDDETEVLEGFITDITESKQAQENLQYRVKLESDLSRISTRLAQANPHDLDQQINSALATLGQALQADRCYLFQIDRDAGRFSNTHEWCAPGIAPQSQMFQNHSSCDFDDVFSIMDSGETLVLSQTTQGKQFPLLQQHMQDTGIQNIINVPLTMTGKLSGFIGLDSESSDKCWPDEDRTVLQTAAEILGTVIERSHASEKLQQHTWYLEGLDQVSNLLSKHQFSDQLLDRLMELLLTLFSADRAWMIEIADPKAHRLTVAHEATLPEYPGALNQENALVHSESSLRLMRQAMDNDGAVVRYQDTERDRNDPARDHAVRSEMLIVVRPENGHHHLMGLHQCSHGRIWSPAERSLFQAVAQRAALILSGNVLLKQVRQSEQRLREAERVANMGHWELDVDSGRTRWSDQMTHILGSIPNGSNGFDILPELIDPRDWPGVQAALHKTLQQGGSFEVEYRLKPSSDQAQRWLYCKGERELDKNGKPVRLRGVSQDITARKQTEADLARASVEWTQAMDQSNDVVYLLDKQRHLTRANKAFYEFVGQSAETSIGQHIAHLIHPNGETEPCPVCRAQEALQETVFTLEPDASYNPSNKPLEVTLKLIHDTQGEPSGMLMTLHDLTHLRQTNEKLRLAERVFDSTSEGIIVTDLQGSILEVNQAFSHISGYTRDEVLGKNPRLWKSGKHDASFYRDMWHMLEQSGQWRGEIWNRRKDGSIYPEWQNISQVTDDDGQPTHYVSVFSDISQIKQSQDKLNYLAHHDALTGLPNRLLLQERLEQAIRHAQRTQNLLAVFVLDVDHFKLINDSFGHPTGDRLLQKLSDKLQQRIREQDTVARIGGDEFILLLEDIADTDSLVALAQKILQAFAEPIRFDEKELSITASLGICIYPHDGNSSDELLRNADAAMYRAKSEGRNNFQFYTQELTRNAFERVLLENNLRQSLDKKELTLYYQPQFQLDSKQVTGAEVLLRWQHPQLGLVSPARFIPIAEETGLILAIGEWVLHTACQHAKALLDRDLLAGRIAVNIAGPQIRRGNLVDTVTSALKASRLPAEYLELEITESFIMEHADSAISQLQTLRDMGITLAIDDFGTGYSSLSYLKKLPIHKLKIDQSFVRDIPEDPNDLEISRAIIALGKALGLKVIAEGVEKPQQAESLSRAGCHEGQGFMFSRPIPLEAYTEFLIENRNKQ